ncbi:MAG TPA: hypothetical protein VF796_09975 [Humisphaera sp.]
MRRSLAGLLPIFALSVIAGTVGCKKAEQADAAPAPAAAKAVVPHHLHDEEVIDNAGYRFVIKQYVVADRRASRDELQALVAELFSRASARTSRSGMRPTSIRIAVFDSDARAGAGTGDHLVLRYWRADGQRDDLEFNNALLPPPSNAR